jgi:hypothetical protein
MNWGFGQLMALPDVLDTGKGYLAPDGSVTFRATVRVVAGADIEQWGGHTTYDSIVKTGMPGLPYWDGVDSPSCLRSLLQVRINASLTPCFPRVRIPPFAILMDEHACSNNVHKQHQLSLCLLARAARRPRLI